MENAKNMDKIYQLTEIQKSYLIGRQDVYELGNVSTHGYYEYKTSMDLKRLEIALYKTVCKHEALRTVITDDGMQKVLSNVDPYKIPVIDVTRLDEQNRKKKIDSVRVQMEQKIIDIYKWPLFDLVAFKFDSYNYICVGFDFIIMDAFSLNLFWKDVLYYYEHLEEKCHKFEYSFQQYVNDIHNIHTSRQYVKDREFWMAQLRDYPDELQLPKKGNICEITKPHYTRIINQIEEEKYQQLQKISKRNQISLSTMLLTSFGLVLARWGNNKNFPINLTISNRLPFHYEINEIIGNFITTMLYEFEFQDVTDFWKCADEVQDNLYRCLQHRLFSGMEFSRLLRSEKGEMNRLLSSIVFTCMLQDSYEEPGELVYSSSQTSQVSLDCQIIRTKNGILISWDYVDDLFETTVMQEMFNQFLDSILKLLNNSWSYKEIFALSENERVFHKKYNATDKEQRGTTLVDLFQKSVECVPDHVAIVDHNQKITYKDLNKKAEEVAAYIQKTVNGKCIIGIIVDRCMQTVINILGILKAGCAYVAIAPDVPEERVQYIKNKSGCELFIRGKMEYKLNQQTMKKVINPEDLAYIIYTSGSTGNPKGVQITHEAVCNTILDINGKFSIDENDKILGISSMSFDLSVFDIFGTFTAGATLVILHQILDFEEMYKVFTEEGITVWNSVPCILDSFICELQRRNRFVPDKLRLALLSGDWIPLSLPERVKEIFTNCQTISLGGATEASIWSIYYPIHKINKSWKSIPYGYPLANQKIYILSNELEELPIGVIGEIFIGGKGVAKGYINEEELTANSFVKSKFGRLYRTGDYGVLTKEGIIEFLGRKDSQVKLFGYRIELNEIESVVLTHEKRIERCCAVVNSERLCLFYVSASEISSDEISNLIGNFLPNYMVPQIIMKMDELLMNSNHKIDRGVLSKMLIKQEKVQEGRPMNSTQLVLQNIWQKVLGIETINVNDNFYLLGGDSLKLGQVQYAISENFGISIPFKEMFQANTIQKQEKLLLSLESK